ncbi:MAG: hypothetical protein WB297_01370 [Actinomycetota bacterium]
MAELTPLIPPAARGFAVRRLRRSKRKELLAVTGFIEGGKLTPIVDRTYALADTAEACAAWSRDTRAARSLSTWREMRRRPLLEERQRRSSGRVGPE